MYTVIAGKPVKVAAVSDYALHIKLAAMELNDDSVLQRYMILLYIKTYTPYALTMIIVINQYSNS